jgi:hypothetical protein
MCSIYSSRALLGSERIHFHPTLAPTLLSCTYQAGFRRVRDLLSAHLGREVAKYTTVRYLVGSFFSFQLNSFPRQGVEGRAESAMRSPKISTAIHTSEWWIIPGRRFPLRCPLKRIAGKAPVVSVTGDTAWSLSHTLCITNAEYYDCAINDNASAN